MLAYTHINTVTMLARFDATEAVRVATDRIYIQKTELHKLEGVEACVAPRFYDCGRGLCELSHRCAITTTSLHGPTV